MNAALERAQARLTARRATAPRDSVGRVVIGQKRHGELQLAYAPSGQNNHGQHFYMIVRYCSDCLRGTVIDLVREVPAGLPSAHELGVKRAKAWQLEC